MTKAREHEISSQIQLSHLHFSIKHELLIFESVEVLTGQFFAIHFPIYFSCDPNHHFHLSVCWIAANRLKFCKTPNTSRKYKVNNINNKVFSNYINLHHVSTRQLYIIASYRYINLVIPRHAGVELCYINWKNVRRNCRKYWKKGKTCSPPRHSKGRQVTGSQQRVASLASSGLPRYTARKFARRGGPFCTSGQNASSSGVTSHGCGFLAPPTWR